MIKVNGKPSKIIDVNNIIILQLDLKHWCNKDIL